MSFKKKLKAVMRMIASVEKQFGQGAIQRLEIPEEKPEVSVIPSGSWSLDRALRLGGYPRGRLVELFGPDATGKSTLALHAVAACQQQGGIVAYIDAEHALDAAYAASVGVKLPELLLSQPDTGEQALEIVEMLARSGTVDLIVVDSVAALVPEAEVESELHNAIPGLQARLMSQSLRKLVGIVHRTQSCVLFLNQIRHDPNAPSGANEYTTGGSALRFYAAVRLDLRNLGLVRSAGRVLGHRVRVRVVKNKLALPFEKAEFDLLYGRGIHYEGELLDAGLKAELVERVSSWYCFGEHELGQGRERACLTLAEQTELRDKLREQLEKLSVSLAPFVPAVQSPQKANGTQPAPPAA